MNELSIIINSKYTLRKLAKLTGIDRKSISTALKCKDNYEMKLDNFLKLIHILYENSDIRRQKIHMFILLVKSPLNIRKALCYSHVSGEYNIIDALIEKHCKNDSVNQYLTVYNLFNQRNKNEIKGEQIIDKINESKIPYNPECQALLNLLYMVAMYDENDSNAVSPFAKQAKKFLIDIDQRYIRDCLYMQYKERLAYKYLLSDQVEKCRDVCQSILDSTINVPVIKAVAAGCKGESYIYENPHVAEEYIELALAILEKIDVPKKSQKYFAFKTTLAHLYIENNFNLEKIDFNYLHDGELAHYECLYGDKSFGLKLYKKLEESGFSAHQLYSYSKITGNVFGLKEALVAFERSGNIFYSRGVKRALMKDEVNLFK